MMKKLVVMRDFATCFTACTRLDEEQATDNSTSTDRSSKAIAYTSKGQRIMQQERNRQTITQKDRYQDGSSQDTPQTSTLGEVDMVAKSLDSRFTSFKEEDFLDFCFRQDGGIEMVKQKSNSRVSITSKRSNSNHKIKHGGNGQRSNKDVETMSSNEGETNPLALRKLIDDERGTYIDEVESAESKRVSGESSDSYHSDTSSSSFAFPVLNWERMGSPVQMPTERIRSHRRRHKHRSVPRHCCRF